VDKEGRVWLHVDEFKLKVHRNHPAQRKYLGGSGISSEVHTVKLFSTSRHKKKNRKTKTKRKTAILVQETNNVLTLTIHMYMYHVYNI
jgi:hypothetical protein